MQLYPDVQRRAQAELDAVVGNDRLPSFNDRDHLPYLNALCAELLRWMPVTPFGQYYPQNALTFRSNSMIAM